MELLRPIVGLGQACIDFLGQVSKWPDRDGKCELTRMAVQGGGPVATALVTLTRLGMPTIFLGLVGDDPFGPIIVEGLVREGVDTSLVVVVPGGRSQAAFIAIENNPPTRTVFWNRGTALDPEKVDPDIIAQASCLHLDGMHLEAALKGARIAKQVGVPVVFDAGTFRTESLGLVPFTDHLICSEGFFMGFAQGMDRKNAMRGLKTLGPEVVVATFGRQGSLGYDGRDFFEQPAFPVEAVDTTGAGDVYHGAYIFGLVKGWTLAERLKFAAAAAAMKCRSLGGRTGIPNFEEVVRFLGQKQKRGAWDSEY